jgi:hypothetical protein
VPPADDKVDDMKDRFYDEFGRVFDKFSKCRMKILLADFIATVGMEDIFKPTIGNKSLQEIRNDNVVIAVYFAISTNLTVRSTMFTHRSIHKYVWKTPNGKTQN